MTTNQEWLPSDYSVPTPAGDFVKLPQGTTRLRILSQPIIGRLDWAEEMVDGKLKKKPLRYPMNEKPAVVNAKEGLKHFWAMICYNYELNEIQVWEITQKSVMNAIMALKNDVDYADVYSYDMKITKEGEKMETKYTILPGKATDIAPEIMQAYLDRNGNLENLFKGEYPFPKL